MVDRPAASPCTTPFADTEAAVGADDAHLYPPNGVPPATRIEALGGDR
jgi:hypothetical protein